MGDGSSITSIITQNYSGPVSDRCTVQTVREGDLVISSLLSRDDMPKYTMFTYGSDEPARECSEEEIIAALSKCDCKWECERWLNSPTIVIDWVDPDNYLVNVTKRRKAESFSKQYGVPLPIGIATSPAKSLRYDAVLTTLKNLTSLIKDVDSDTTYYISDGYGSAIRLAENAVIQLPEGFSHLKTYYVIRIVHGAHTRKFTNEKYGYSVDCFQVEEN